MKPDEGAKVTMKLIVKGGVLLDWQSGRLEQLDVLINAPHIKEIGSDLRDDDARVIDARGKVVVPGLVDVHVHFRQPGQEYKEDIHTGSLAAAAGGFTTVIAEANTNPPIDTPARVIDVLSLADRLSVVNFHTKACITERILGERLVDVEGLKKAGARAISDDGHPIAESRMMEYALKKGKSHDILVNPHCEESEFYRARIAGSQTGRQGVLRMPYSSTSSPYHSEGGFIKRDLGLAERTGARIHISHVSLAESVKLIADAKKRGVRVTAEAAPHHFVLTKEMAGEIGPNAKVNPPLRSKEDVDAIKQGLADGTIDIIASDHAPHSVEEKNRSWDEAPFGVIGLETTLGLVLTFLVGPGILSLAQAIKKMSSLPAKIFGVEAGDLRLGAKGDLTIIDPNKKWRVDSQRFYSRGRNCPFDGLELQGKAVTTVVKGNVIMQDGVVATQ